MKIKINSIGSKISLIIITIMIFCFSLFLFFAYNQAKNNAKQNFNEVATVEQNNISLSFRLWIEDNARLAKIIANDDRVINACLNPQNAQIREKASNFVNSIYKQSTGLENIPISIKLDNGKTFVITYDGKKITITNGNFFIDTVEGKTLGKCNTQFSYMKNIYAGKDVYICKAYPSILRGNPIFVIASQIKYKDKLIGVSIIAPQLDYFTDRFIKLRDNDSKNSDIFFFDDRENILASLDNDLILNDKQEIIDVKNLLKHKQKSGFITEIENKKNYLSYSELDFGDYTHEDKWFIGFAKSEETVNKAANKIFRTTILSISFIIFIIIAIILWGARRYITVPLRKISDEIKKFIAGDFLSKIPDELLQRKDEVGELATSFDLFITHLGEIIQSIKESIANVSTGSEQISNSSQQIAQGANEQAASAEQIGCSIEEMVAAINQNTEHAQETKKIALRAEQGIIESQQAANNTLETMQNIAEKISIINNIAEKTDLLAINAAIEAARAGEFGKGFSVVALEIRKLAENTQKAANQIVNLAASSLKIAEKSGIVLTELVPDVQNTSKLIQEISAASMEQNTNVNQINNAVQQFNSVVQENSSTAEELSTGSEELASQSMSLKNAISFFKFENNTNQIEDL